MRRLIAVVGLAAAAVALLFVAPQGGQAAEGDPIYSVTIAARACPSYEAIMANRARNNIQESLRDLGKDTVYASGQPISVGIEEPNHPDCVPLPGWQFQFGDSASGPKRENLSTVTRPARITTPTQTVPLLDDLGNPTGATLPGAVNVQLSSSELALAQARNLWVQGGTALDPLLYGLPVNSQREHGFGALRCAVDNLNGDNVEFIAYPNGVRHVVCYYYTVDPAPSDGTIVVRKQLATGSDSATFHFNGNISYIPGGNFDLAVSEGRPAETTFIRAAGDTWDFTELANDVFQPTGPPVCTTTNGRSTFSIAGQRVEVTLGVDDRVVCTYTNERRRTGALALFKVSSGAVGSFDFRIQRPDDSERTETAVTEEQNVPVSVADAPEGPAGTWVVTESLPPDVGGSWDLARVECNGEDVPFTTTPSTGQASVDVAVGEDLSCTAFNTFTPAGAIQIRKITQGGTGTFTYHVRDLDAEGGVAEVGDVAATTAVEGEPMTATGDDLTELPVSVSVDGAERPGRRYEIQELSPPQTAAGSWILTSASCGALRSGGSVIVTLDPQSPSTTCTFMNTLVRAASVELTKQVTGDPDGRSGDVSIDLTCAGEATDTLTAPAGQDGPFTLPEPHVVQFPQPESSAECVVQETDTGVAAGATVQTSILVTVNGQQRPIVDGGRAQFSVEPGDAAEVTVVNRYAVPATPTPTPTPSGSTPVPTLEPTPPTPTAVPSPTPPDGSLAQTGATAALMPTLALGVVLLGVGVALAAWARRTGTHR